MKNVTITLDEEVARWVRIRAAKSETSVSRMVGELLRRYMLEEEGYEAAMNRFLSVDPEVLREPNQRFPKRDEIYDRSGLR